MGAGAERVWDGGARGSGWNDSGNWVGFGVPAAGDDLRFPAGALQLNNINDFASGTAFRLITYSGAGYVASGNEIDLTGGLVVSHGAGSTVLNMPFNLAASQTFTVGNAGANLFLNGRVDLARSRATLTFDGSGQVVVSGNIAGSGFLVGSGGLRKNGNGVLYILQHLTLSGPTLVNGGVLRVDGSLSNSLVTLQAGATLRGTGRVGGLTANAGATVSPGGTTPDILDVLGELVLAAGSELNLRLNGTSPGIDHDQLRVQGQVTLGGVLNLSLPNGFVPPVGHVFTLIDNAGTNDVAGTFAGWPEGAVMTLNGRPFRISYGSRLGGFGRDGHDVTLEAVPALAVWDGGGGLNKFWSQPLNWSGDTLPLPGDDLHFSNGGAGTLITSNDFPAGRVFGALIFDGGKHLVGGNRVDLEGTIAMAQAGEAAVVAPVQLRGVVRLTQPGRLILGGDVTLRGAQTFWAAQTNAHLYVTGRLDTAGHALTIRTEPAESFGQAIATVHLGGSVTGTGSVSKVGAGRLDMYSGIGTLLSGTVEPELTIREGTVNGGDYAGRIRIEPGAGLVGFGGTAGELEVRGGRLVLAADATVLGDARFLDGAVFETDVHYVQLSGTEGYPESTALSVGGMVELRGCSLRLRLDPMPEPIVPGSRFEILSLRQGATLTGTFDGLPEGAWFLADGHGVSVSYGDGVAIYVDPPFVWDGGGVGNLASTPGNWVGDSAPVGGVDLVFPPGVTKRGVLQDYPVGTVFRTLTFSGPDYVVAGNSFGLSQGITNETAGGATRVSADVVITGNPVECRVGVGGLLILEGRLTRSGTGLAGRWRKSGGGVLRLTGAGANHQTTVEVNEGEVQLAKGAGVDSIGGELNVGDGTNSASVAWLEDHQIEDTVAVRVRWPARLELNAHDEAIGGLSGDGAVNLGGRLFGRNRLTVHAGSFGGEISGEGGLIKAGAGAEVLTLRGTNTYTGGTVIAGGILMVDGFQPGSDVTMDGGVLGGRGRVGRILGRQGGVVRPGFFGAAFRNRLGCGDAVFGPTTTYRPLLTSRDPDFENSALRVEGVVDLGGSALDLELFFVPAPGSRFVIVENDKADAVIGTFAGMPEQAEFTRAGQTWRITYAGGDGNDVELTLVAIDFRPVILSFEADFEVFPGFVRLKVVGAGVPRAAYDFERSGDFLGWNRSVSVTADGGGLLNLTLTEPDLGLDRFYRLKLRP